MNNESDQRKKKKNMTYVIFGETRMMVPLLVQLLIDVADSNERWIKIFVL